MANYDVMKLLNNGTSGDLKYLVLFSFVFGMVLQSVVGNVPSKLSQMETWWIMYWQIDHVVSSYLLTFQNIYWRIYESTGGQNV